MDHVGKVIIPAGTNVWPHELKTAKSLALHGITIEFVRPTSASHTRTADCLINNKLWEIKSPASNSPRQVQRALRDALKQSPNVIFDSRRMKGIPDEAVERELRKWSNELKSLKRLLFVKRGGSVIDIK